MSTLTPVASFWIENPRGGSSANAGATAAITAPISTTKTSGFIVAEYIHGQNKKGRLSNDALRDLQ
jgi:hypothetical protein